MKGSTWHRLDQEFSKHPVMVAGAVDRSDVERAARELGCSFDPDFAEFVCRYGGALVGSNPILGILQAEAMGFDSFSVVEVTKRYRDQGWPGIDDLYVVSIDGAGNPIFVDLGGRVWLSDHNSGQVSEVAQNFEQFLLGLLEA